MFILDVFIAFHKAQQLLKDFLVIEDVIHDVLTLQVND